jgi:hypothetical protein
LADDEFWSLTLPQLGALLRRHKQTTDREDYRAGLVASILVNVNRRPGSAPAQPGDFFPSLKPPKRRRQTTAEALAVMRLLFPKQAKPAEPAREEGA